MKKPTKIALIGAGGIGCNLAPILSRMHDIVIVDQDVYEPKNVLRQFPALKHTGNKAQVLADMVSPNTLMDVGFIPSYVKDYSILNHQEWRGVDFIISGVDNNESREIICEVADSMEIPAILAGNEHEHGEAHLFAPELYNPFENFDFKIEPHTAPWGCNADSVVEEFPQTPTANFLAAGCAMHLLLSWIRVKNPVNSVCYSRTDALSNTFKRVRDMKAEEIEKTQKHLS